MKKKYKKRSDSIDRDYWHYLGQENIYGILFGHRLNRNARRKARYIWRALFKEHYGKELT